MEFQRKSVSGLAKVYSSCNHLVCLSSDLAHIPPPNTPCSSDLSVWCYSCNAYLNAQLIPQLQPLFEKASKLKFGETLPFHTVEHVGTEANQADGCESKECNHREGKRRRRRRRGKNSSMEGESTKKSNETSEKMSNEGPEGALGILSSSSASESNENDLKFTHKQCLCGKEAMIKILKSEKNKNKMYYACGENKCDLFELCFDNEALAVDTRLPEIQSALRNQVLDMVDVAELKAEVRSLTSRINIMESNFGLMKMMVLMNLFYGLMLMVVVIAVLFKL
ncbi:unnamed protein product [Dovyalis caffra]|uniref:Uncharacterized protein n=1 Tax=Dovyalis caffra TaxID=77055 RepID=A0AAV1RBY9_9ROSI|nr:unnamed protein product [Dovyalis caffra]